MLEQRIQQHFIDSADLKYQPAQVLSHPTAAAVQPFLACVTSGGKVLACGNGPSAAEAQQFAAFCVAGFEREGPELAALAPTSDSTLLTAATGGSHDAPHKIGRQVARNRRVDQRAPRPLSARARSPCPGAALPERWCGRPVTW